MDRRIFLIAALSAGLAGTGPTPSQSQDAGPALTIKEPWSRATPGGAKVAAGYLVVENGGTVPDRLLGGSAEIAGAVEFHETVMADGVARMRPLADLEIKPGDRIAFKPGGYHIMFVDLKRPLREGERFQGALRFERAGTVPVTYVVRGIGAGQGHSHSH